MNQKQVAQRYLKQFLIPMTVYVFVLIASRTMLNYFEFSKLWQIVITLAPVVPITFAMIAFMRFLMDSDELQQRIHLLAIAFAALMTSLITFSYGFLELIGLPKFPILFIFPMMVAIWGLSLIYFMRKYQ